MFPYILTLRRHAVIVAFIRAFALPHLNRNAEKALSQTLEDFNKLLKAGYVPQPL
jgi:RIO-like serine/threonine protein kinase